MADREDSILASVALKAAVELAAASGPQDWAQVTDAAEYFLAWLKTQAGEREGGVRQVQPAASQQVPVAPPPTWFCPNCQSPMKQRKAQDGSEFFGCSRYPDCRGTRRLDGSTSLPKVRTN